MFRLTSFFIGVYYCYFSVDCSTDKPKQFRWNFHKKTKSSNSNSSHNSGNCLKDSDVNSLTEDGILRLNELIDFLSKPESKCTHIFET